MKILSGKQLAWLAFGFVSSLSAVGPVYADDPAAPVSSAPLLPYGVADIIQLSQAQVSDSTILTFIRTSGDSYGLNATQIVYLRQQGVSEAVVDAMLTQPKPGTTTTAAATALVEPPPLSGTDPQVAVTPPAPDCAPPASSVSVYVIPDTATDNYRGAYYNYNPGSTWSFYPSVVYIGGGGGWVGTRGGWHGGGGWYHSGGWHH